MSSSYIWGFIYPSLSLHTLLMFSSAFLNTWRIFKIVVLISLSTNSLTHVISLSVCIDWFFSWLYIVFLGPGAFSLFLIWPYHWGNIFLRVLLNPLHLRRSFHSGWWEYKLYLALLPTVGYFPGLGSFNIQKYCQPKTSGKFSCILLSFSIYVVLSSLVLLCCELYMPWPPQTLNSVSLTQRNCWILF